MDELVGAVVRHGPPEQVTQHRVDAQIAHRLPVAVIGAEEQAPAINLKPLARLLGSPSFPVVPYPPFVPLVPLPVKYRLYFGEPIFFDGDADDDDEQIEPKVKTVVHRIQSMIHMGLRGRRAVFW